MKNGNLDRCILGTKHATGQLLVELVNFPQCRILLGHVMEVNTRAILQDLQGERS